MKNFSTLAAIATFLLFACKPDLGLPASLVTGDRILAIRATPPEVPPNGPSKGSIVYDLLAVIPQGRLQGPLVTWDYCTNPHPPSENNIVGAECLSDAIQSLGNPAPSVSTNKLISQVCSVYGPDPQTAKADQAASRPPDPDVTGGYYQPVRAEVPFPDGADLTGIGVERVTCPLPTVSRAISNQLATQYPPNQNPLITEVAVAASGQSASLQPGSNSSVAVTPNATIEIAVAWNASSIQRFPVYDLSLQELCFHFESLTASWFASAGSFALDQTTLGEPDAGPVGDAGCDTQYSDAGYQGPTLLINHWTAPAQPELVHLWVVLRDSRGGLDFQEYALTVQ